MSDYVPRRLVFDIETDGLLDEVTKVHSLCIKNVDTGAVFSCCKDGDFSIKHGIKFLGAADVLIGHNILTYDLPVLKKLYDFEFGGKVRDTLIVSRLIWTDIKARDFKLYNRGKMPADLIGRHSLESWGCRLGRHKIDFDKGNPDRWSKWTPAMQEYCENDVEVNALLWKQIEDLHYSETAIDLEHDFRWIIHLQERHGFPFDVAAARKLQGELAQIRDDLTKKLQAEFPPRIEVMKTPAYYLDPRGVRYTTKKIAGERGVKSKELTPGPLREKVHPFNPGSRDEIASRLMGLGWKPQKFTDTGKASIDDDILEEAATLNPVANLCATYLLIDKRLGQLSEGKQAWLAVERNGRIYGAVNTNGAVTGRCTHFKPNVAQVPKVKVDKAGNVLLGLAGGYGFESRSLFTCGDPSQWELVGADASGLEARMFAHFLARYDGGAYAKILLEGDIHTENQRLAGLPTRDAAKTFLYATLYGAGDAKIGTIVGGSSTQGRELKARFMAGLPAFAKLTNAIHAAVRTNGYLTGLDGRRLHVRSAHSALNTLLQSAGALVMKRAAVILYQHLTSRYSHGQEFAFVANIHDEVQLKARRGLGVEIGEFAVASIKEAGESFGLRLPLDGAYRVGNTWAETH